MPDETEAITLDDHTAWERLVERFADGRPVCNCRQAYYTRNPNPHSNPIYRLDGVIIGYGEPPLHCAHGCSANKLQARDEIAERVEKLLDGR